MNKTICARKSAPVQVGEGVAKAREGEAAGDDVGLADAHAKVADMQRYLKVKIGLDVRGWVVQDVTSDYGQEEEDHDDGVGLLDVISDEPEECDKCEGRLQKGRLRKFKDYSFGNPMISASPGSTSHLK